MKIDNKTSALMDIIRNVIIPEFPNFDKESYMILNDYEMYSAVLNDQTRIKYTSSNTELANAWLFEISYNFQTTLYTYALLDTSIKINIFDMYSLKSITNYVNYSDVDDNNIFIQGLTNSDKMCTNINHFLDLNLLIELKDKVSSYDTSYWHEIIISHPKNINDVCNIIDKFLHNL